MAQLGYINVKDAPYNAKGDGAFNDTTAIQAAFTAAASLPGATVFIPAGVYMVGVTTGAAALTFSANGCKVTGGGTLKHINGGGVNSSVIFRVLGERNLFEWLRIDWGGASTNTDGFRDSGKYNRTRNLQVAMGTQGGSLQPLGQAGSMHRCISDGAYEGVRAGGDFNTVSCCASLNFSTKGYNNNDASVWTYVVGCHVESTTNVDSVCGYQTDPGNVKVNGWTTLRDCTANTTFTYASTTSVCKFSWIKSIYVNGCQFLHTTAYTLVNSFRVAGNADRCRLKDTFMSREMFFQNAMYPINPAEVRLERVQIGDGNHLPTSTMRQSRCNVLIASDSLFQNFSSSGIDWDGADGTYSLIVARNCDFIGNLAGNPTFDIAAAYMTAGCGQLNRTRKIGWYANRRKNNGAGGTALFTNSVGALATSDEELGFTLDGSMSMLAGSDDPDGTFVMWAIGDIMMNTSPVSGQYVGWVFTSQSPITWKEWGIIS